MRRIALSWRVAAALCACLGLLRALDAGGAAAPNESAAAVAKGNNQFAFDLYHQLRDQGGGNLFFSPSSISTALAMTYAGARGRTAEDMAKALHFPLAQDTLHPAYGTLLDGLNTSGKKRGYELSVANALWGQKGYGFRDDFRQLTKKHYGAGLSEVDFTRAEEARKTINDWVEKETQEKIKDLIKEGMLDARTRLVLTNAIYFKGDWDSQFKKDLTKDELFHVSADRKIEAPLMHQTQEFGYLDGGTFQALEMPYVSKDLSMVVLLPKTVDGLADLEQTLSADKVAGWLAKLRKEKVIVSLPKFKTTSELGLKDQLSALGMRLPFEPSADFSGVTGGPKGLYISAVVHKAFVAVNEEGTEAAAATGVVSTVKSVQFTPTFRADHPFVFLIRDKRSDAALFLGRIVNPAR